MRRLRMWLLTSGVVVAVVLGGSGRWADPWLLVFCATWSGLLLAGLLSIDEDLARERFTPPDAGADRIPLVWIRLTAVGQLIVGALDYGRWQIAPVPSSLRVLGLAAMIPCTLLVMRAMAANRYFSAVVRIQRDRGHQVIDRGPYALVRHPGYAGMMLAVPASALALGSWLGVAVALGYAALIFRRVRFEDRFLRSGLDGYGEYAARVPYRLVPGVW